MTIENATEADAGDYRVVAENDVGQAESTAAIKVHGESDCGRYRGKVRKRK